MTTAVPGFAAITCATCDVQSKQRLALILKDLLLISDLEDKRKDVQKLVCLRKGMSVSAMRH